ncbi:MAG: hypothetical protein ACSLE0_04010 [Chitinophagaceae bacterium]
MKNIIANPLLIRKYNQPVPRYTSYPTIPFWNNELDKNCWEKTFTEQFSNCNAIDGISLYIHP